MTTLSLELSKELQSVCKEKNITMPESEFYWYADRIAKDVYVSHTEQYHHDLLIAPAYTLDELLEWLFAKTNYISIKSDISPKKGWTAWCEVKGRMVYQEDPNPVNAACKLLIWLIKEGLIRW